MEGLKRLNCALCNEGQHEALVAAARLWDRHQSGNGSEGGAAGAGAAAGAARQGAGAGDAGTSSAAADDLSSLSSLELLVRFQRLQESRVMQYRAFDDSLRALLHRSGVEVAVGQKQADSGAAAAPSPAQLAEYQSACQARAWSLLCGPLARREVVNCLFARA